MKSKILLADNILEFLEIQARLLERDGYHTLTASSVREAEELLDQAWVHLAIIDLRMEDENDAHDISGLLLAQKRRFRSIPKIILTAYPDYESAVAALGPIEGYPSAIDYVAKQKGPGALSEAVAHAFAHYVRLNFDLHIDWKARDAIALVNLIEPGLERERLLNRAEELEDLIRRLFDEKDHIRIDRLLWQREGRVALTVFAFKEGAAPESFVVVYGQNAKVLDEVRRYDESVSKVAGQIGIELKLKAETTHFAANAYHLANADLENVRSLAELYRADPDRLFHTALSTLLERTLAAWIPLSPFSQRKP